MRHSVLPYRAICKCVPRIPPSKRPTIRRRKGRASSRQASAERELDGQSILSRRFGTVFDGGFTDEGASAPSPPYGAGCSAGSEEDSDAPVGADVAAGAAVIDGEAAGS